ncbi:MAG: hypothetical protein ACT4OG_06475 [Alphaproteobacteria bacterium]
MDLIQSRAPLGAFARLNLTWLAVLFWAVLTGVLLLHAVLHPESVYLSTDDNLRLAAARDLLSGQSWFDATQHRMNVPYGLPMHWSRLVDGGVALLILLFRIFLEARDAELVAIYVWPLLWLLPSVVAVTRLGERLGGHTTGLAALLLVVNCASVVGYFHPGTIDQHNVHIALTLWGIVFVFNFESYPKAPVWLALVTALNLAMGLETLPYILAACAIVAWLWVIKGEAVAAPVRNFGLIFAGAAAALLALATPTAERLGAACDTYSGLFGVLAIVGGAGLGSLALLTQATRTQRILGFALLAAALFAITLISAPECLSGPYAHVGPSLNRIWLSRIEEVLSPFRTMSYEPGTFFATYVYASIGLAATIAAAFLIPREKRRNAIVLAIFSAIALAITSLQVRGMPFAILFGLPGMAATIIALAARYSRTHKEATIAAIAAVALFTNITFDVIGKYVIEGQTHVATRSRARAGAADCMRPEAVTQLATLPKGRVAAMVDQGPVILANSRHSVVAGPYHRDEKGILDTYKLFTRTPESGARILRERDIDYVMICRSSPDYTFYLKERADNTLLRRLDAGQDPPWLERLKALNPEQKVRVFRILRDRLPG